ncbi:MAG: hypothetical protein AB1791_19700 [Chloroflexota bacterium]
MNKIDRIGFYPVEPTKGEGRWTTENGRRGRLSSFFVAAHREDAEYAEKEKFAFANHLLSEVCYVAMSEATPFRL